MKRVLIVDDEPHVVRVQKLALERAGYQVHTVPNGERAWEWLQGNQPDVLIADIQMPRMDGKELCRRIEEELPNRRFLILVITSRTEVEHREWSRQIKNAMFLEKPASMRRLTSILDDYCHNNRQVETKKVV